MSSSKTTTWQSYEEVARYLLDQLAENFSLGHVEGKQLVAGASGISWEIDAKAVRHGGDAFLVVECRRHPDARLKKKDIAALAYVIADTGAAGGIVVTPLELQAGAKRVAEHANIIHVKLSANSTTADYLLKFLNQVFAGVTESIDVSDDFSAVITRATGSTERKSGA